MIHTRICVSPHFKRGDIRNVLCVIEREKKVIVRTLDDVFRVRRGDVVYATQCRCIGIAYETVRIINEYDVTFNERIVQYNVKSTHNIVI